MVVVTGERRKEQKAQAMWTAVTEGRGEPRLFAAHKATPKPWSDTYREKSICSSNIIFLLLSGWLRDWHLPKKPLHQLPMVLTRSSAEWIIFLVWVLKPDQSEKSKEKFPLALRSLPNPVGSTQADVMVRAKSAPSQHPWANSWFASASLYLITLIVFKTPQYSKVYLHLKTMSHF